MNKPLLVITGPTASGKSSLAMKIAQKYNGEIICADSKTVYKGMDIGTAKPTPQDQVLVKHHLLDVTTPNKKFSVVDFKKLALEAIDDICSRNKLPIMVGGTGLYVDSVIFDYQFGQPANPQIRADLQNKTVEQLKEMCLAKKIDLPSNPLNKRHLIRALEVGRVVNDVKKLRPFTLVTAIKVDKDILRSRIEDRAQQMFKDGVLEEAKHLAQEYGWDNEAMTGNIYRILKPVILGRVGIKDAQEQFVISDMQLAKKQMTWLKRNPYVFWGDAEQIKKAISIWLEHSLVQ